mmetsp:Transcript_8401/g.18396  ORF Transcript_8401/g.18396 Transcript_8401/m.18396 type:complete len:125 (-) Transcript_8401:616-990(-)
MPWKVPTFPLPIYLDKPTLPRPQYICCNQSSQSSSDMDHQTTGKINHAHTNIGYGIVVIVRAQKSLSIPNRPHDNGIDERGEEDGIAEISHHLTSFRERTRDYRGGGRGECILEEKESFFIGFG